jgi:hypothetical protein
VPLIKAGHESRHQHRDAGPSHRPSRISRSREGFAPRTKRENAQDAVADHVSTFANVEVPNFETLPVHAKKIVEHWIEDPAGIAGGEQRGGLDGDDNQPQDRGDPGFEKIVPSGGQSRALLDGIVGSLAGDHNVMDVALAESSAADAHEARFLQKFADGSAAAVAHA